METVGSDTRTYTNTWSTRVKALTLCARRTGTKPPITEHPYIFPSVLPFIHGAPLLSMLALVMGVDAWHAPTPATNQAHHHSGPTAESVPPSHRQPLRSRGKE